MRIQGKKPNHKTQMGKWQKVTIHLFVNPLHTQQGETVVGLSKSCSVISPICHPLCSIVCPMPMPGGPTRNRGGGGGNTPPLLHPFSCCALHKFHSNSTYHVVQGWAGLSCPGAVHVFVLCFPTKGGSPWHFPRGSSVVKAWQRNAESKMKHATSTRSAT